MGGSRKFFAILIGAFAVGAAAASPASASQFTASTNDSISGSAVTPATFTFSGGTVQCGLTSASGSAIPAMSEIPLTVKFSACKVSGGLVTADISPASIALTANQSLDLLSTITISVTLFGTTTCQWMIGPQGPLSSISYSGALQAVSSLTGITYTSTGSLCGASGTNGTYGGTSQYVLTGGSGTLTWDS
jgi:hypothetical protein